MGNITKNVDWTGRSGFTILLVLLVNAPHEKKRLLEVLDALFQEAYACAAIGSMSEGHYPRQKPRFPTQADPCSFAITKGIRHY